jgi:uncharacterized protein YndB with AHSA1/START domain
VADVLHDFPVAVPPSRVFAAFSTPAGLDSWWTLRSTGVPKLGEVYRLDFGPGYEWHARVTRCTPDREFELELTQAMEDWAGTRVGVVLEPNGAGTQVRFRHSGWPEVSEHFRISSFCWAMYLRVMRRNLEFGEIVPYESRLSV